MRFLSWNFGKILLDVFLKQIDQIFDRGDYPANYRRKLSVRKLFTLTTCKPLLYITALNLYFA